MDHPRINSPPINQSSPSSNINQQQQQQQQQYVQTPVNYNTGEYHPNYNYHHQVQQQKHQQGGPVIVSHQYQQNSQNSQNTNYNVYPNVKNVTPFHQQQYNTYPPPSGSNQNVQSLPIPYNNPKQQQQQQLPPRQHQQLKENNRSSSFGNGMPQYSNFHNDIQQQQHYQQQNHTISSVHPNQVQYNNDQYDQYYQQQQPPIRQNQNYQQQQYQQQPQHHQQPQYQNHQYQPPPTQIQQTMSPRPHYTQNMPPPVQVNNHHHQQQYYRSPPHSPTQQSYNASVQKQQYQQHHNQQHHNQQQHHQQQTPQTNVNINPQQQHQQPQLTHTQPQILHNAVPIQSNNNNNINSKNNSNINNNNNSSNNNNNENNRIVKTLNGESVNIQCGISPDSICSICNNGSPIILKTQTWANIMRVVFYCLKIAFPSKGFFNLKHDVYGYMSCHWDLICFEKKRTDNWHKQIQDILSHSKDLFESGMEQYQQNGFWRLRDLTDPWTLKKQPSSRGGKRISKQDKENIINNIVFANSPSALNNNRSSIGNDHPLNNSIISSSGEISIINNNVGELKLSNSNNDLLQSPPTTPKGINITNLTVISNNNINNSNSNNNNIPHLIIGSPKINSIQQQYSSATSRRMSLPNMIDQLHQHQSQFSEQSPRVLEVANLFSISSITDQEETFLNERNKRSRNNSTADLDGSGIGNGNNDEGLNLSSSDNFIKLQQLQTESSTSFNGNYGNGIVSLDRRKDSVESLSESCSSLGGESCISNSNSNNNMEPNIVLANNGNNRSPLINGKLRIDKDKWDGLLKGFMDFNTVVKEPLSPSIPLSPASMPPPQSPNLAHLQAHFKKRSFSDSICFPTIPPVNNIPSTPTTPKSPKSSSPITTTTTTTQILPNISQLSSSPPAFQNNNNNI